MLFLTGNSVLMNLLVNGEDLSNGYKKYSVIESSQRSPNANINNNYNQKTSLSKKSATYEGQDIR